jgi:hypothetical protein
LRIEIKAGSGERDHAICSAWALPAFISLKAQVI